VSGANLGFERFHARFSGNGARPGLGNVRAALRLWVLGALLTGLITFGCGAYATLEISAPATAKAGSPFTITVTAMVGGNRDTIINSAIKFTSSDPAAVLPPIYYFNANDAGSHTFTNGVTLMSTGSQSITASAVGATGLTGSANVTVSTTITAVH